MLNPNNDRLNYGGILYPPMNFKLDFAIGTTYSLDLDALVGSSISLGLSQETDSNLKDNPIFLLEALRSTGDKIALFCEKGRIRLPNNPTQLYILLEDMVFQVDNPKQIKDKYASFHPKFWLLRFTDDNENILYKLIVLSRNLTFDRSWDISFSMNGEKIDEKTNKNEPISKFIEFLMEYSTNDEKTNKMKKIVEELSYIKFDLDSKIFDDFEFIINGLDEKYSIQNYPLFKDNWDGLFIMSPFLSKTVIKGFNERKNKNSKAILLSRYNSLENLKPEDCDNFEIYSLKNEIIDGEDLISEGVGENLKQDIHAKLYLMEKDEDSDLYLGSLNASHNALFGNIELMIKLHAKKKKFNIKKLTEDIFNGENDGSENPFQIVDIGNIIVNPGSKSNIDLIIKKIVRLNLVANVISKGENYNIELNALNFNENEYGDYKIQINPLLSSEIVDFSKNMIFEDLTKIQLSEFFVLTISLGEDSIRRIIKVPTTGMPDDRQNDVISSIINDETAFIIYLAFLLGDDYIINSVLGGGYDTIKDKIKKGILRLPELYEKMLRAALYAPEKFIEIDFLINTLSGDNVIPEGFEELYNTFLKVVDLNGGD